jgi:arylsulfatase A-like enzyme
MTSLYLRDHGVYDNESGIGEDVRTLAEAMAERGMQTGAVIGFPHLNPEVSGLGQGFDRVVRARREERRASATSARALALIEELRAGARRTGETAGFFVWVHYVDPHAPYDPPSSHPPRAHPPRRTPMADALRAAPRFQRNNPWFASAFEEHAHTEDLVQRYIAEIEAADAGLGELLAGLAAVGGGDTLVVVTSDHGENMGEHDLWFHHGGLYPETTGVPLIMAAPGMRPTRVAAKVASVDVAPTILELVRAPRREPMRGRSLVPVVAGDAPGREVVFSEHMKAQLAMARNDDGALILQRTSTRQFPSYPFVTNTRELYDLRTDPHLERSLPAAGPLAHALEDVLQEYLTAEPERFPQLAARGPTSQDRESLRALGYIE